MLAEEWRRSPRYRFNLCFALSVLVGFGILLLQARSYIRLLDSLGFEWLPGLMLVQAAFSWLLVRNWEEQARRRVSWLLASALFFALLLTALEPLAARAAIPRLAYFAPAFFYVACQITVAALRLGLNFLFAEQVSLLRYPRLSIQVSAGEELGLFFAAACLLRVEHIDASWLRYAELGVLALSIGLLTLLRSAAQPRTALTAAREWRRLLGPLRDLGSFLNPWMRVGGQSRAWESRRAPYLPWLLGLFSVIAVLKGLQGLGLAYGLSQAGHRGWGLLPTFARLYFVQSCATLLILWLSWRFSNRIASWSVGFNTLLLGQGTANLLLVFFGNPFSLMGAETLRKFLEHGFLTRSLQLLTSNLPDDSRFEARYLVERWSTTAGLAMAGFLGWLVTHHRAPFPLLLITAGALAFLGLRLRQRLSQTLTDFHLGQLTREDGLQAVLTAGYALASPQCGAHYAAVCAVLENHPRPAVTKVLLHSLGRMQNPKALPSLRRYLSADREDIQVAAIEALENYPGHEVDLCLLRSFRELVRAEVAVRLSAAQALTRRLGILAVPYLLETLEEGQDTVVQGNAVEILGEIARNEKDQDLMDYLARFLSAQHSRRARANATVLLYSEKNYRRAAIESLERFLTSEVSQDLNAFAYIAGMLGLRAHEPHIWSRSEGLGHRHPTLLVSLIRLGNPQAPSLLAKLLASATEEEAEMALLRLSSVATSQRIWVLYELLENHSGALGQVLEHMRRSQRNFQFDRDLLREEARRLGLILPQEEDSPERNRKAA